LTGRAPFHGRPPSKVLAAHLSEPPEPVGALRPDLPPPLADFVMRCLEKDPACRPQSASEVLRGLDAVATSGSHAAERGTAFTAGGALGQALALYAFALLVVGALTRAAITVVGLPDWVFPGALAVMALGLPIILVTALVHHQARLVGVIPATTPGGTPVRAATLARLAGRVRRHLTWRRAALGSALAMVGFALLVAGYMALRALGLGPAGSLLASGKLAKAERVLV